MWQCNSSTVPKKFLSLVAFWSEFGIILRCTTEIIHHKQSGAPGVASPNKLANRSSVSGLVGTCALHKYTTSKLNYLFWLCTKYTRFVVSVVTHCSQASTIILINIVWITINNDRTILLLQVTKYSFSCFIKHCIIFVDRSWVNTVFNEF